MPETEAATNGQWLRTVVDRFEGPLERYAARLLGNAEAARDVVQDTFLRLCRAPRPDVEDHVAQWLYTVCRRRALDVCHKERRMLALSEAAALDCPSAELPQPAALERQEAAEQVLELVAALPRNQQEVIRLKFQHSLSYREISEATGLSVSNIGYLLHTALARLRAGMGVASASGE